MEIKMKDGLTINCRVWECIEPKAALLIIHGMAEHINRYDEFAKTLSSQGIQVYGYDQRGHGETAGSVEKLGYFGPGGWPVVVEDVGVVVNTIKNSLKDVPLILFGHSMGSFVVRDYARQYAGDIDGLIISGTGASSGIQGKALIFMAALQKKLRGPQYPSVLIDRLTNKTFNKNIKPLRTSCDWLSYDENQVDLYVNDPYCGTCFSCGFYEDLFKAVESVNSVKAIEKMNKKLPVLIFSGNEDPVGNYGKGVKKVKDLFEICGMTDVEMILYENGRHEMLNEVENERVYQDINNWISSKF